jgi:RNA recognition motif-containing protein
MAAKSTSIPIVTIETIAMADRRTLFVQGVPKEGTRESLWNAFLVFGEIVDIKLSGNKETALVEFAEESDASAALDNMHLAEHFGQTIFVSYATKQNLMDRRKAIWDTA